MALARVPYGHADDGTPEACRETGAAGTAEASSIRVDDVAAATSPPDRCYLRETSYLANLCLLGMIAGRGGTATLQGMRDTPGADSGVSNMNDVESVAIRMASRIDVVTRSVHEVILRDIVELGGDQNLIDLLGHSVAANVAAIVDAVRYRIEVTDFEVPAIATEYARRLAQRNVPLEALVRAYRLGQTEFLRIAFDEARATQTDAGSALLVAQQVMAITAEYIDWVTQRVIGSYSAEREHWLIQRNVLRSRHIRRLLAGKYPENGSLDEAIDFPLRLRHIAVVAWMDDTVAEADAYTQIDLELRRFKEFLPLNGESLLVPADQVTIWAWFPLFSQTTADQVAAAMNSLVETSTKRIFYAVGTIESGGHGFRVSHARAQLVRKVMLAARTGTRVGTFADRGMSVTALWGDDLDRAQDWVSYVLGPLADDAPDAARLRETLEVFLTTGSNYGAAAETLHVHPNTVKYRVTKAQDKLGVTTLDGRIDVALALVLCRQLGGAVLIHDTK